MNTDTAFAVIQHALETFSADVGKAQAEQAASLETLAAVEYELDQMRKLLAETAFQADPPAAAAHAPSDAVPAPSDVEILGEHVGGGLLRRLAARAA